MRQLTINPNNRQYYSEDFIKGFNCGAQRQFEADKSDADRPQGEWVSDYSSPVAYRCTACNTLQHWSVIQNGRYRFCPNCGARMKGADDERGR